MQDITGKNMKKVKLKTKVTSILFVEEKISENLLYKWLITGDETGDVRIQVINDNQKGELFILKSMDIDTHITCICTADLRNESRKEIVVINSNGLLCGYTFPLLNKSSDPLIPESISLLQPVLSIQQIMLPNIISAFINDLTSVNGKELYIMMTDRVIRSYRFNNRYNKFIPTRKWDLLINIDAWSIGCDFKHNFSFYAQLTVKGKYNRVVVDFQSQGIVAAHKLQQERSIDMDENTIYLAMMPVFVNSPIKTYTKIAVSNFSSRTYHYLLLPDNYYVTCLGVCSSQKTDQSYAVCVNENGVVLIYSWKCPLETSIGPIYRSFVGADVKKIYIYPLNTESIAAIFLNYLGNITYAEYYYSDKTTPIFLTNEY
ncbi:WD40-repeat-containing domain-containing protein [Strongyloides ratti]|uniref:WD40-repeat-containing domain-containing protein n=1 Tax=Strongyloides ratti TaxID=34506 RepID=A0A090L366_STRRB|nr:WD40-repeat-containing domain-containing protein [Strongyloides ratti]CEF64221.1 WD40-repeat-containing domain-containing protein [Strongyloides ratti]